ncbi:Ig-like domain-containing protein [Lachnospiraceae bacterium 46-15]
MKKYLILILLFCFCFKIDVYAGNVEDEIFLSVGEKYVIEQQEGVLATYTSENEEIAAIEGQVITGKASGETYIVVNNDDHVEKKIHIFVGDYKLCLNQEKLMEFNLSSVTNAWDSSASSSDTSVVSVAKQGYDKNNARFLFKALSTGMVNITINSRSSILESFIVVVKNHSLAYYERIEPTCSQKGSIAHYECLFCNRCFSDSDGQECIDDISIDESEHEYVIVKIEEATCNKDGYAEYMCQNCQYKYTQLLKGGHEYETRVVEPGCINQGYTIHTCKRCGEFFRNSYVGALGHNFKTVSYMNNNSIAKQSCAACGTISYQMNIEGVMVNQSLYQRKWSGDISDHYVPLNEECFVTSSLETPMDAQVDIKYQRPIRESSGKLKIYDIKTIYQDMDTKQVMYDNAINSVSFSYNDDYIADELKANVGHGVSECELKMDYDDEDDDEGALFYSYDSFENIGNKHYSVLGITFKMEFQSKDKNPYQKISAQYVELSKDKLKITKGFSKELKVIYDRCSEYKPRSLKWKSSNKKIATVNSSGKVTAKKPGKCTITCKLPNGRKAKCKITVVKNEYKGKTLSKCNSYKERYGNIHFEVNGAYYKGNQFVLKCVVMNARIFRANKFDWVTISARDTYGHVLAKKKFENVPIGLDAYGKKYITFTFPKSAVKKKRELYQGVWISTDYVYQYSY